MKKAIIIAVEYYQDPYISQVEYAKNDANDMSAALKALGFEDGNRHLLIDADATYSRIHSRLDKVIDRLNADDTLYIFYAGHGFSKPGRNFITCSDTDSTDWEKTSVSLEPYFKKLQESPCQKIVLFLDCCESGIPAKAGMRSIYDNFNERELEDFFTKSTHCVCFTACRHDESSYSSRDLKHGIWTHHLLEALRGEAALALKGKRVVSSDLQNHLADWVPRTLRITYTDGREQTPWVYGGASSEFEIADLTDILAAKSKAKNPDGKLTEVSFVHGDTWEIKSLKNFNRTKHNVPKWYDSKGASWAAGLASEELTKDLDAVYDNLLDAFGYASADLTSDEPEDGIGSIMTPTFKYTISASLNKEDLSELIIERRVHEFADPDVLSSPEFEEVFGDMFDTLEFSMPWTTKIEHIVNTIQSLKNPKVQVKPNRQLTYCDITLAGIDAKIHVDGHTVSIVHRKPVTPVALIDTFKQVSAGCITHNIPLIA